MNSADRSKAIHTTAATRREFLQRSAAILAAASLAPLSACDPREFARARGATLRISIAAGNTGGVFYPYAGAIAAVITRHVPNVAATAEVTGGTVDNMQFIRQGTADLAFATADMLDEAFRGIGPFEKVGRIPVRVLATLYYSYLHVATLSETGVRSLSDLRGKVVILHFVYTSCPDECPLHAEKLAEVQEMIAITPMKDQVVFVTVTTDPARDTAEVMRGYGPLHGLDPSNWMFLTAPPGAPEDTTRRLAERFGLKFTQTDDGLQMHGVMTIVIDREGAWRASFHGLRFDPTNLVLYVNALVNDVHLPSNGAPAPSFWERLLPWF